MDIQTSNELENIKQAILNTVEAEAIYLWGEAIWMIKSV